MVEALAAARLVVVSSGPGGEVAELAHQSLIERWPRLRNWLDADEDFLRWRYEVRGAAPWWARDNDPGSLLRGAQLRTAQAWVAQRGGELDPDELAFVRAGAARLRRETRLRRAAALVVVVLALVVGVRGRAGSLRPGPVRICAGCPPTPAAVAGLHP